MCVLSIVWEKLTGWSRRFSWNTIGNATVSLCTFVSTDITRRLFLRVTRTMIQLPAGVAGGPQQLSYHGFGVPVVTFLVFFLPQITTVKPTMVQPRYSNHGKWTVVQLLWFDYGSTIFRPFRPWFNYGRQTTVEYVLCSWSCFII